MSPEAIAIVYIATGTLFVILFGKALQVLVERTQYFWGGKKTRENELLRIEQNALNIKIDALVRKLDTLRSDFHALRSKVDAIPTQLPDQLSIVPTSETRWPEAEIKSAEQNTWARLAAVERSVTRTTNEHTSGDTWTR